MTLGHVSGALVTLGLVLLVYAVAGYDRRWGVYTVPAIVAVVHLLLGIALTAARTSSPLHRISRWSAIATLTIDLVAFSVLGGLFWLEPRAFGRSSLSPIPGSGVFDPGALTAGVLLFGVALVLYAIAMRTLWRGASVDGAAN
jgi:hypothetical protein